MSLRKNESGKIIRVAAGYDMTANTELTLDFILPDETTAQKTKTGGEVTLGTSDITDDDLGALLANEYVEYVVETGFLSQDGVWTVQLTYTDSVPTPPENFIGLAASFSVQPT